MAKQKKLHDRDFEWGSYRGRIKVKDMGETHLVNVTHMVRKKRNDHKKSMGKIDLGLSDYADSRLKELNRMLKIFYDEMTFRNIPKSALKDAPYEFQDGEGCIRLWDYESRSFKIKHPSVRFIVED